MFDKSKILITKITVAQGILKLQHSIRNLGVSNTDFGFNIPWAPVLLVLKF